MNIFLKLLLFLKIFNCQHQQIENKYLFYDVNPSEGFNLRRDVYIRIANLVNNLNKNSANNIVWTLILPPWSNLYHWKSEIINQEKLKWSEFFDLNSLKSYIPVMELDDYTKKNETNWNHIDLVYYLQNYKQIITENFKWIEKADLDMEQCDQMNFNYYKTSESKYKGYFWLYDKVFYTTKLYCVSYQGTITLMEDKFLKTNEFNKIMIDRAEIMLHENYGQLEYWKARQSMRYSFHLEKKANEMIRFHLNNSTQYLGVHLRRADFVRVRKANLVSIDNVVSQIEYILVKLNLTRIYLATDTNLEEINELKNKLSNNYTLIYFKPTVSEIKLYKDGGIAIIDQIICAYSDYFIGTYESTFSFRIQEDREILGIHKSDTTFNRFCFETNKNECKSTKWLIKH